MAQFPKDTFSPRRAPAGRRATPPGRGGRRADQPRLQRRRDGRRPERRASDAEIRRRHRRAARPRPMPKPTTRSRTPIGVPGASFLSWFEVEGVARQGMARRGWNGRRSSPRVQWEGGERHVSAVQRAALRLRTCDAAYLERVKIVPSPAATSRGEEERPGLVLANWTVLWHNSTTPLCESAAARRRVRRDEGAPTGVEGQVTFWCGKQTVLADDRTPIVAGGVVGRRDRRDRLREDGDGEGDADGDQRRRSGAGRPSARRRRRSAGPPSRDRDTERGEQADERVELRDEQREPSANATCRQRRHPPAVPSSSQTPSARRSGGWAEEER